MFSCLALAAGAIVLGLSHDGILRLSVRHLGDSATPALVYLLLVSPAVGAAAALAGRRYLPALSLPGVFWIGWLVGYSFACGGDGLALGLATWLMLFGLLIASVAMLVVLGMTNRAAPQRAAEGPVCPRCGYCLSGNPSGRCPECGRAGG